MARIQQRRRRRLLVTLSIAGLAVLFAFAVFLPRQERLLRRQQTLQHRQRFILAAQRLHPAVLSCERELAELRKCHEAWAHLDRLHGRLALFLAKLSEAATASGLEIRELVPGARATMPVLERTPVHLHVTGAPEALGAFFYAFDQFSAFAWVERLEIRAADPNTAEVECELDLAVFASSGKKSRNSE